MIGVGVAQDLAQSSYRVILIDISDEKLRNARTEIRKNLRLRALLQKGGAQVSTESVLNKIETSTDYELLKQVDFVIENATEKWEIKKKVYSTIDRICPAEAIFAANTSAIPITRIASLTNRPSQVIGIHLMNPVPLKSVAEVNGRYCVARGCVGIAQACLDACDKHVNHRKQFGHYLKGFQLVRQMITRMICNIKAARALCLEAARAKMGNARSAFMEINVAKYFASLIAFQSATDAVQIHGALGCSSESSVQRYFRDAKIMEIIEGSNQIHETTIAEYGLRDYE